MRSTGALVVGDALGLGCHAVLGGEGQHDHGGHEGHHIIDIADAGTKYNLFRYQQDFNDAYEDITKRGVQPILCGGTGLYIEAVLKGYALSPVPQNPQLRESLEGKSLAELTEMLKSLKQQTGSNMHNHSDVDTAQRAIRAIEIETYNLENNLGQREMPAVDSLVIGVDIDRELRRQKITKRLRQRLDEGMVDEIRSILDSGVAPDDLIYYGCLLYTSPSPRDRQKSRMPSSA